MVARRPFQPLHVLPALALLVAGATGQASSWSDLDVAQGVVSSALKGQGKLVTYDAGTTLHVFSAVTRSWHALSKSPAATIRLFNDCVVIVEPNGCQAFSSHTGRSESITTTGAATVLNPVSQKNDSIALVHAGTDLHAFSAFTGAWVRRPVSGSFAASAQRHVAVLHDGPTIAGMSAFDGTWHEHQHNTAITATSADGTVATASGATAHFAFSAHIRSWQTAPAPGTANFVRGDDWVMWLANGSVLAFSGLRGNFVAAPMTVTGIAGTTDLYALLTTPSGTCAYSAVTGDLLSVASAPSAIDLGGATALLHDGTTMLGYSALRQQVAPLPASVASSSAGNNVAVATTATGQSFAWSSYTASWHPAPPATAGFLPTQTTTTIAFDTGADAFAFGARTGQFVPLGAPIQGFVSNPTSAPLLAHGSAGLAAFDTDAERWVTTPRQATSPPVFSIWRTSAIVIDGQTAHGFGAQTGAWQSQTIPAGNSAPIANSEVGHVVTSHRIAACSMLPEIVAFQQFPHFRRVQPLGAPITFAAAPADAAFAIAAFAQPTAPIVVPGLGELMLDSNHAFLAPVAPSAKQPVQRVTLDLPADPILSGTTLASQLVVLPQAAPPYLSARATVTIW